MNITIPLHCRCGQLSGAITVDKQHMPTRLMCYCKDCQCYARHLGHPDITLNEQGGTDVLQISPAQFTLNSGANHLANLQLSAKGIYRWYASCCNTPICNTPSNAGMPYVGLLTANIKPTTLDQTDITAQSIENTPVTTKPDLSVQNQIDALFGPIQFGVGAGALHPIKASWPVSKGFGFRGMLGTLRQIIGWRLKGDHKRSELIDSQTGKPLASPHVLTAKEREAAS